MTKLEPRSRPIPNQGSQLGGLLPQYSGSIVHLVTGDRVLVLEDYPVADARLWPVESPVLQAATMRVDVPQGNIIGLSESLSTGEVHAEDLKGAPDHVVNEPPTKKAPAKKAGKPQLIDRTETINKISVVKDEPIEDTSEGEE